MYQAVNLQIDILIIVTYNSYKWFKLWLFGVEWQSKGSQQNGTLLAHLKENISVLGEGLKAKKKIIFLTIINKI